MALPITSRGIQLERSRHGGILLAGNFLSASGGNTTVCEELGAHLAESGWQVVTTSRQRNRVRKAADMVVTTWLERHRYQVAHVDVYSGSAFAWAEAVAWTLRRARRPYVLTLHGGNLPAFARRWPRRVGRLLCGAAAVTVPSRYLLDQMRAHRADIALVRNPLHIAAYPYRLRDQVQPALVWLRALHALYNPVLVPRVIARLVKEFPAIRITMAGHDKGDGSLESTRQMANALGVADRITFAGSVPKTAVPALLDSSDIFINTTNIDNTPVSVGEAMACGLCVVSTNVGGIPYMLRHEHDALLVAPDDPEAMAAAIRRILTDQVLARSLSRNARLTVEDLDWSSILPQWDRLFHGIAQARRVE